MSLAFLIPAALAALAALLIPLLIHLARRSEQRPTQFAALRWLRQKPKPRHRIRFDEWPLLIVRLLLVALMAVLLARPVLHGGDSHAPYVAVVPGVDPAHVRDLSSAPQSRVHWLASGFPSIETPPPSTASVTSLLRELDASLPADVALTVVVPERLQGADGQRVMLSRRVDWRVVPGAMPVGAAPSVSPAPVLVVRYASANASSVRYLRAASAAWQPASSKSPSAVDAASIEQAFPLTTRNLAWLSSGTVPINVRDWARAGGTLLLDAKAALADAPSMTPLWRDEGGEVLIEGGAYGRGRVLRFTVDMSPRSMPQLLDADFAMHLRAAFETSALPPSRVLAHEHAPVTGGASYPVAPRDLQPWLALAIALLFLVERWLATGSRRMASP